MPPDPRAASHAVATDPHDAARAKLRRLLERFDLELVHPSACLEEAAEWLADPGLDDPALSDLTDLPFVTIDNDDSKDLDQALYIAPLGAGHRVWYALADAAYYVRPGSSLFAESLRRGASYYLPELVVPMLPPSLSEGLVSLNPSVLRRALVFRVDLDERAEVQALTLERARIRSRAKLTYPGVQRYWDGDLALAGQDYTASLDALRVVGARRIALAEARHVVQYQRVEIDVGLSESQGFVAFESRRHETDRANEQISLLINVEGARLLAARAAADPALQAIFRVHPAPLPADLAAFERMTRTLALAHAAPALAWRRDAEPLARWLDRLASSAAPLRPVVLALQRQALLLNQQSTFSAAPSRHYGVGAPCYARFSSPMREVVGIYTHKEALELLGLAPAGPDDEPLRVAVIDAANRAKDLQRQLTKAANQLVIASLLGADLRLPEPERPRRPGTVVGLAPDKAYVVLDQPPLELKLYARDLGNKSRLGADDTVLMIDRAEPLAIQLGDRLTLVANAYDAARDRFALTLD